MNTANEKTPNKQNDDILKSLRNLNSCITLTSVKEGNSGSRSPSPSDSGASSEEDTAEDSHIPSALRGISIQGASVGKGTTLSSLLKGKNDDTNLNDAKPTSVSASVSSISSSISALRGVSIQGVGITSKGGESIKDLIEKAREQNRESEKNNTSNSVAQFGLRGVSIQGVTARNSRSDKEDSEDSDSSDRGTSNKSSTNLPSFPGVSIQGITATKVTSKDRVNEEDNSSDSSSAPSSPGIPSALRGISIQGATKDNLLSKILGKPVEKEEKIKDSQSAWINEWSKRCVSISFTSQNKDSDDEESVEKKGPTENGSHASSAANSASNSRDSITKKKEQSNSPKPEAPSEPIPNPTPAPKLTLSAVTENVLNVKEVIARKGNDVDDGLEERNQEKVKVLDKVELAVPEKLLLNASHKESHSSQLEEKESPDFQETEKTELLCHLCSELFCSRIELLNHILSCTKLHQPTTSESLITGNTIKRKTAVARKNTRPIQRYSPIPERIRKRRECIYCGIFNFRSYLAFEEHHAAHIRNSELKVYLKRCSSSSIKYFSTPYEEEESDHSRGSNSGGAPTKVGPEDRSLKLTFKISQKRGRGRKKKRVEIINNQDMNEAPLSPSGERQDRRSPQSGVTGDEQDSGIGADEGSGESRQFSLGETENRHPLSDADSDTSTASSQVSGFSGFENNLGFNTAEVPNDRPSSTYQPQFESFPGDWFNEYESGSRIAAAMTGSSSDGSAQNGNNAFSSVAEESNTNASFDPNVNKEIHPPPNGDGLFSQAVLGAEAPRASEDQRQGSFEQLCLNDSYGHSQPEETLSQPPPYQESQQYHNPQVQSGSDLLSELAYLNNSGHQAMDAVRTSPHDAEQSYNSHNSNSGTPTSAGHPTPPPTDTSFRALATSPTSPMNAGGPTPPMQGSTPPIQNSTSPLQQMSQMGTMQETLAAPPRLTIANNLMPTTTNNSLPQINAYNQPWATHSNSQPQNFPPNYMQPQMTGSMAGNMGNVRPASYANMPVGYRPSPPARIRGRPPLIGHVARPAMIRGPGRPPGTTLPNLMPAGGRGGMMPNLRQPQFGPNRGGMMGGQKRTQPQTGQSPNKNVRREDINVPSRQKDNECQIIAVANRADGLPVIANVQGRDERSKTATASSTESTIHLSDSITLSVRPNQPSARDVGRNEKGGDAGVVANLLASRGITVTPAAGEKESGSSREERRLPTASDLNLSSAISVHPPTSRDRDGFAVPHPPSASRATGSIVNSQVDRPARPPTVDLTQDVSASGSPATRIQCSQCERTFPTQALLADHAKIHQQQAQSRMPHKCHLCTAGFSSPKGQQHHYQNFHQLHLSAGDLAIPVVDFRNPVNVQRMARLGIRSFLPLSNLQNRGSGGIVGIPILSVENLQNGQVNMQQWGITDILTLGPPKTLNPPR